MKLPLREQIYAAFLPSLFAGLSQLTIPLGLIPLTGQTFAVGLAVTFLGMRTGTMSILIYLLLGLIGLPVFAGRSKWHQRLIRTYRRLSDWFYL